jgi:phosphate transport system substrate-binding protein
LPHPLDAVANGKRLMSRDRLLLRLARKIVIGSVLVLVPLSSACQATVEPHAPVHLEIAGSTSMQPLLDELADAYAARYDYVSFDIEARGTRLGLDALREGSADMAMVSRELRAEESEGVECVVIAYDAIAVLVNDQNAVEGLTLEQLRGLFSGDIVAWSEVGGEEVDVQVLSREDGSGTRDAFEELVMQGRHVTLTAIVLPRNSAVGEFVAQNPASIGYASSVGIPLGARALEIEGSGPDLQALSEDDYPLTRPFVLATLGNPDEDARSFVDFVLSPAGQVIVGRRYGRAK